MSKLLEIAGVLKLKVECHKNCPLEYNNYGDESGVCPFNKNLDGCPLPDWKEPEYCECELLGNWRYSCAYKPEINLCPNCGKKITEK